MKKIIAIVALCFLGLGVAQAQVSTQTPSAKSALQTGVVEMLTQKLNLSPQQVSSITKIMGVFAQSRKTITESTGMTADLKAEKLKKINDREDLNMKNILDETQYAKFQELAGELRKG
ncbi:hypothetical protein [uncultured Dokdonia sp.]|uniref:hypothetical protein n=1 Tax=uncultured Dokdonia sp. TaxID=575653 RepID=UPI00261C1D72|nr:hypothetical protein [uncultured Dokdonia sp.]